MLKSLEAPGIPGPDVQVSSNQTWKESLQDDSSPNLSPTTWDSKQGLASWVQSLISWVKEKIVQSFWVVCHATLNHCNTPSLLQWSQMYRTQKRGDSWGKLVEAITFQFLWIMEAVVGLWMSSEKGVWLSKQGWFLESCGSGQKGRRERTDFLEHLSHAGPSWHQGFMPLHASQ